MRPNGNSMNINPTSFYSVDNGQKFAPDRAAAVRRRLLKSAATLDDAATPEETLMLGHWLNSPSGPPHSRPEDDAEPNSFSGADPDLGDN